MPNISQHEAAELWEIARDHYTTGAKLQFLCQHVQDTQLRSMLEQHSRRLLQVGQQVAGFLGQESPGFQGHNAHGSMQSSHQSSQQFAQFQSAPSYSQQYGAPSASLGQGGQSVDILAAGEALKDFKHLAIAAVRGATESSQPARNTLYQLAGEHLQMADQHYRWLEQRGIYASPKADHQSTAEYSHKLRQIAQAGQQAAQAHTGQAQTFFGQAQGVPSPSYQQGTAHMGQQYTGHTSHTSFAGVGTTGFGQPFRQ